MPITDLDITVLVLIARYYVLTRDQVQRILFPDHKSGRCTRKRLNKLRKAGYITRHKVPVCAPGSLNAAPVYYPTRKGAELLAGWFDDESLLLTTTKSPRADRLNHWIAAAETRMIVEQAVEIQEYVALDGYINEWQEVVDDEGKRSFLLHTQLMENPPLSCSPDAAFMLDVAGHKKVFYLEVDLSTSSPNQIAARKTRGYAELAAIQGHRRHFPQTNVASFSIVIVTSKAKRCLEIGKALSKRNLRPDLWLVIDRDELTAGNFLHAPIVYDCQGQRAPLVQAQG